MKISDLTRNSMINALTALIDGGAGPATLAVRTGVAPTNTTDVDAGVLLATCTFSDPSFGASSAGTATANAITADSSIDATGTAGHFRVKDSVGVVILQGSVALSGGDLSVNSTAFVSGGTFSISALTITQPSGA